jgi:hypothetical protein
MLISNQFMSIITNSVAVAIIYVIISIYTNSRINKNKILKWYDYIFIFFISMLSGILLYSIIGYVSNYYPMSKTNI